MLTGFGFVILAILIGSQLAPMLIRVIDRIEMKRGLFYAALVFALLLAWLADKAGSAVIIGAFAGGLVLARTHRGKEIEHEVQDVAQFFIPIFFVVVGAAVDLRSISPFDPNARRYLWIGLALTAIGVLGKVLAGFVVSGKKLRRIVIGVGMVPRGEVGLIFATIGLSTGLLDAGLYSAVALMVMLTTFIAPPLLRRLLVPKPAPEPSPDAVLCSGTPARR